MTRRLGTSSGREYCAFPCGAASCKSRTGACAARQPRRAHASHAARACSCDGSAVEHARLQLAGYLAARDARRSAQAGTLTAGEAALLTERDELVAFALDPAGSGATAAVAWQGAMAVSGSEESPVACDVVALGALLARVQAVLKKEGLLDALEGGVDTAVRHGGMQRQHNMLDKRPCRAGRVGARRRAISAAAGHVAVQPLRRCQAPVRAQARCARMSSTSPARVAPCAPRRTRRIPTLFFTRSERKSGVWSLHLEAAGVQWTVDTQKLRTRWLRATRAFRLRGIGRCRAAGVCWRGAVATRMPAGAHGGSRAVGGRCRGVPLLGDVQQPGGPAQLERGSIHETGA